MPNPLPLDADATAMLGESPAFLNLLEQTSRVAAVDKPVLVIGERGTGKELIAARLHFLSSRWDQPLVKLNCATLTESLLETELFGHEAGAFTGATGRHVGRFEQADGGTLFLDELANVSLRVQEKILRAVEYGQFERVGGSETVSVDVRIVGATNDDLPAAVRAGRFRADLLDRLAFDVLNVPPLRVRSGDILRLAEHFAVNISRELGRELFAGFTPDARDALLGYAWPGNVRELKNVVERSVHRAAGDEPVDEIVFDPFASAFRPLSAARDDTPTAPEPAAPATPTIGLPCDLKAETARLEVELIERALAEARYNQTEA
ncbi:MAG TPA: phage shock protein operon transcriptional activator, partial [Gammaproteobacteria bacterium]|nr:phage shock protein operon transcriptional activator [Gammaproteobacteria bacterium]